jgi:general secretion pathway protein J
MKARGFTLLEILIAMAIFTLIGIASTGVLTSVIDSDTLSSERFAKLQSLQRTMMTMERDIGQAVERKHRVNGEQSDVVIQGGEFDGSDADGIAFIRAGWQNPKLMLPRSTLQYVAYRLKDEKLERLSTIYVDSVIGTEPKVRTLLTDVSDFQVEFYSAEEDADSDDVNWMDDYTGQSLPKGIAITITSKDFGELRRVFSIGGTH